MKELRILIGLAAMAAGAVTISAASPDISGRWWNLYFEIPGELSFKGTALIGGNDFSVATDQIQYSGTLFENPSSAEERGIFDIDSDLIVIHRPEEPGAGNFSRFLNLTGDIMLEEDTRDMEKDSEITSTVIALRPPVTLTLPELAGQWHYRYYESSRNVKAPSLTPGSPLEWSGLWVEALDDLSINANGLVANPDLGGTIGRMTVEQGLPVFNQDESKATFYINSSKDVMAKVQEDTSDDGKWLINNLSLLVRRPDSLTVSDIVGRWHVTEIYGPQSLWVGGQPGNLQVVNGDDFADGSISVTLLADGRAVFIDPDEGELVERAWSLAPNGILRFDTGAGQIEMAVNRSKTFAVGVIETEEGDVQLDAAVKYSDDPIFPTDPSGKKVDFVLVEKSVEYIQDSAASTTIRAASTADPDYPGAYSMMVDASGSGLENIAAPKVTVPSGSTISAAQPNWFNNGNMFQLGSGWRMGANGGDWRSSTKAELDALFANGIYTINVLGSSLSLNLSGDAYPPAPLASLDGGTWGNGVYVIDSAKPVVISLPVFPEFASHVDGWMEIGIEDWNVAVERYYSDLQESAPLSYTIPADRLQPGQSVSVNLAYSSIVSESSMFPESREIAAYTTFSLLRIAAQPTLKLELNGETLQVLWEGGELESAPSINGPWSKVIGAVSPRLVTAAGAQEFYRISSIP